MDAVLAAFLFGIGLVVGSFLNVVIYRLPRAESIAWPASHCTTCDRPLAWYENIPVASWAVLHGRCRTCRAPITIRYPIVELITGTLFVGAYFAFGLTALLPVRLVFTCAMVVLFAVDLEHQILPNEITLPGIAVGLLCSLLIRHPDWKSSLIALLAGGLFPFLVAEAYLRIRGREGMGMGDFKMLAMVGAFLGWPLVWITLILACVLGVVIGGGALLISRRGMATRIPFGTFIAVVALVCSYFEHPMLDAYNQALHTYLSWMGLAS
jgi:leader peptidase (prepilin peptidase)/N-methyltransferase